MSYLDTDTRLYKKMLIHHEIKMTVRHAHLAVELEPGGYSRRSVVLMLRPAHAGAGPNPQFFPPPTNRQQRRPHRHSHQWHSASPRLRLHSLKPGPR